MFILHFFPLPFLFFYINLIYVLPYMKEFFVDLLVQHGGHEAVVERLFSQEETRTTATFAQVEPAFSILPSLFLVNFFLFGF